MMKEPVQSQYTANGVKLNYYEIKNNQPVLIMLHAQGADALSFKNTFKALSKVFHLFTIDCLGHGKSDKNRDDYTVVSIGQAIIDFVENLVAEPIYIVGHSSGGLIAAYVAANTKFCAGLILEDPPFFSCQGSRRYSTFNYMDLSTVCHQYIIGDLKEDFVLYYFQHQKMWDFFPEKNREKIKPKLLYFANRYRMRHPEKPLKVPLFPKNALAAYQGMNEYDPYFGEAFYNDTFNAGILHADLLKQVTCRTLLMKAKTNYDAERTLLAAMSDEDANLVAELIERCEVVYFECGHGIHIEMEKKFIRALLQFVQ